MFQKFARVLSGFLGRAAILLHGIAFSRPLTTGLLIVNVYLYRTGKVFVVLNFHCSH